MFSVAQFDPSQQAETIPTPEFLEILESESFQLVGWDQIGQLKTFDNPAAPHEKRIMSRIDADAIRQKKLRVVLDCNHGSGAVFGPELLKTLGCDVVVLGPTADGQFAHRPEPLAENLTGLSEAVIAEKADVGFAQDPDADRLAIVDNNGRYIGEELTLALCADHVLSRTPGPVVVAVVVSPAFDRVSARPFIEMVSASADASQRLFVLDVRHHPSVVRQCRAFARALEGYQRTLEIEHHSRGGLATSASRSATASGSAGSPGAIPTAPLRVVHPPVLLAWPLHTVAEVVPASVRFEIPRRPRRSRASVETRPDIDPTGLLQPWASAS